MYIVSTSQKKKERKKERKQVHIVSASLVLLPFLLGSPIFILSYLFIYLFIFLLLFSETHVWIFTKPTTVRNYIYILLQILLRGR